MKKSLGAKPLALTAPVWVIGSYGEDGAPCLMTAAWCGVCCSEPACVAVAVRKSRLSHANIAARKAFTVNIPGAVHVTAADYIGLVSGRDGDKFSATGLTPVAGEFVDAPYVAEFPVVLECEVAEAVELGSHTLYIGRIADAKADEDVLGVDGLPVLAKADPPVSNPVDRCYYAVGRRLGAAYSLGRTLGEKKRV
jgi:flavin reductase (DIM6/NTAB) family NADH-FMN oxidoreductase RutF